MGCQCCRMIKSYIYDPSVAVDGRKSDPASSSLYQPHLLSGGAPSVDPRGAHGKHKQGIHNPGFSKSNDSTLKLEADNNHVNHRLHSKEVHRQQASAPPAEGALYIIQPEAPGPRWIMQEQPSQVPVYPEIQGYRNEMDYNDRPGRNGWSGSTAGCRAESLSVDDIDEGVGGTPEYPCDTGDEGSVLSVDIQTSTTSLSSADTKDERKAAKTPELSTVESGIVVTKSEDEEEEEEEEEPKNEAEEVASVTDSMVAEALAALEEATAGEEFE